jgi:hypothetical protein
MCERLYQITSKYTSKLLPAIDIMKPNTKPLNAIMTKILNNLNYTNTCACTHTHSDENRRKRTEKLYFYFRFYIFLAKTGSGSENTGSETESEYADIRKRTNTDGKPEN